MKKLFLLIAAGGFALNASAQSANTSLVKKGGISVDMKTPLQQKLRKLSSDRMKNANKATAGGSRLYNYVEHLGLLDNAIFNNQASPYMWFKPDMYSIYGNSSGGTLLDTMRYASFGVTFDALDSAMQNFNDFSYAGQLAITNEPYVLDSVYIYGAYLRNAAKTSVVDTLRVAFVYGNGGNSNMRFYYMNGPGLQTNFGHDTVRFYGIEHDTAANIAMQVSGAPSVIVKDVILTTASLNDTDASGFNKFAIPVNMNVPGRNYIGMTVTFKTGETYTPFTDTVFTGVTGAPVKYGMFRPLMFEQRAGGFPTYTPGDWNTGHVKFLPDTSGWAGTYVPSLAYTAPFPFEFPYIDFKVTCATCSLVSVKDIPTSVTVSNAYPNPATETISIPFTTVAAADVKVVVTNAVGATIATQNLGKMNANQSGKATFSVANYANGVYFYTVEANGQRVTKRFVVTH